MTRQSQWYLPSTGLWGGADVCALGHLATRRIAPALGMPLQIQFI